MSDADIPAAVSPAAELFVALERLLAVGALYPAGHARCREAAVRCARTVGGLTGGGAPLRIRVSAGALFVGSEEIDLLAPGAARVQELLFALAISRVEITPGVSAPDLLTFAGRLAELRVEEETRRRTIGPSLDGFPESIRVRQRVFGGRLVTDDGRVDPDLVQLVLDRMAGDLEDQPVSPGTWDACRDLVKKMVRSTVERLDLSGAPSDGGPRRSLEDVLELGVQAIQSAIEDLTRDGDADADLRSLSRRTEQALALSADERSMEIMLDVLRQSQRTDGGASPAGDPAASPTGGGDPRAVVPEHCTLSLHELEEWVVEATGRVRVPDLEPPLDGREPLSVVIQLLLDPPGPQAVVTATEALPRVIAAAGARASVELLSPVVTAVLTERTETEADRLMTVLLRAVRTEDAAEAVALVAGLDENLPAERLWPHIVNELLLGEATPTSARLDAMVERVRSLPADALPAALARLDRLDAVRSVRLGPVMFAPPRSGFAAVYTHLLDGPTREAAVTRLHDGVRASGGDWPGSELLTGLPGFSPVGRERLARVIARGDGPVETRAGVATVVIDEIAAMPAPARRAPGVASTLESVAMAVPTDARPLLLRVRQERKLLLLPRWPRACRDAAARALARISEAA